MAVPYETIMVVRWSHGTEMVSYGADNGSEMVSFYTYSDSGDVLHS